MSPSLTCLLRERPEDPDGSPPRIRTGRAGRAHPGRAAPRGYPDLTHFFEEPIITTAQSLTYVEDFAHEDDHLAAARQRAAEVGVTPISPGAGAALSFLAGALGARSIVEIGTGTGVSGLWLLRGMLPDGVLTSVDLEAEHQRHAREIFAEAEFKPQRFRLIAGAGLDVMPRMTDSGYDMVFLDGEKVEYGEYLDQAVRLVRPGGVIVFDNALWHDRVADPAQRDPETMAIRDVIGRVDREDDLRAALLPVGDGLLAVQRMV